MICSGFVSRFQRLLVVSLQLIAVAAFWCCGLQFTAVVVCGSCDVDWTVNIVVDNKSRHRET